MGLRADIQGDIAEAFDADLADAVLPFDGERVEISDDYDPDTGSYPETKVQYSGRGVFGSFNAETLAEHLRVTDTKLTALQNEVTDTPKIDDTINGKTVKDVRKDPASATWTLALREV